MKSLSSVASIYILNYNELYHFVISIVVPIAKGAE